MVEHRSIPSSTIVSLRPPKKQEQQQETTRKKKNPFQHLIAGGIAGFVESSCCHPLDTIKTRMQLRRQLAVSRTALGHKMCPKSPEAIKGAVTASLGPIGTATRIIKREGFFSLYKGLSAVYTGIVPKMAIRFFSFEKYTETLKSAWGGSDGANNKFITFFAGLGSGLTEAILVVTPAEVCKIRLQSQYNSMIDPKQMLNRKYRNVLQTASLIVREEGLGALYKGILPTMMRQGINQAANFSCYQYFKRKIIEIQDGKELKSWQQFIAGGVSGAFGPMINNPLDVIKTRIQRQVIHANHEPKYKGLIQGCTIIAKEEGFLALWKGLTPRLLRIVPGQAITFMIYEFVVSKMNQI